MLPTGTKNAAKSGETYLELGSVVGKIPE